MSSNNSSNVEQAKEYKQRGNQFFAAKEYQKAIDEFTKAIELDPSCHVYFSNRSGAYASMEMYTEALEDAKECIKIKPDWVKGFTRKGLACYKLKQYEAAMDAYNEGLKLDPNHTQCKEGVANAKQALSGGSKNPMDSLFGGDIWAKLQADPVTREYLKDQSFVDKIKLLQTNPNAMTTMMTDPQVSAALGVILGLGSQGFQSMNPKEGDKNKEKEEEKEKEKEEEDKDTNMKSSSSSSSSSSSNVEVEEEEEEEEVDMELEAEKARRKKAIDLKLKGNTHYKNKEFEKALEYYNEAIKLDEENISIVLNKAAVYMEKKEFDECISLCDQVSKHCRESKCYDFKVAAKTLFRKGTALERKGDYNSALVCYKDALLESPLPSAQLSLKKLEKKIKLKEETEYLSEEKSEEAKNRGNEYFKEGKWVQAIEEYTDAIKRNPNNYKVYSNRAGCYSKLMDWNRGLEDCNKCIELKPDFVKAFIRKAKIEHFLKQYHKALETYEKGLKIDPNATELIQGQRQTMMAVNNANNSNEQDPERAKEAMKDPEIQAILQDPTINSVLRDMQSDPAAGQKHLANPVIMAKIQKLIAAGVLKVGQ